MPILMWDKYVLEKHTAKEVLSGVPYHFRVWTETGRSDWCWSVSKDVGVVLHGRPITDPVAHGVASTSLDGMEAAKQAALSDLAYPET